MKANETRTGLQGKDGGLFKGDNLLNQIVNISKAGAYDTLANEVKRLQAENSTLKQTIHTLEAAALEPKGAYTD